MGCRRMKLSERASRAKVTCSAQLCRKFSLGRAQIRGAATGLYVEHWDSDRADATLKGRFDRAQSVESNDTRLRGDGLGS